MTAAIRRIHFSEFILFECLTSAIVAHAWLSANKDQTIVFYVALLLINLICLGFIYMYYKEQGQLVDYNDDMSRDSFLYILGGVVGMLMISIIVTAPWRTSSIYVPLFAIEISTEVQTVVFAALYNFALVSNSEETTKLVMHNAIYMYLDSFPRLQKKQGATKTVAVVVPIGFWAGLHAYIAYIGVLQWPLVASAFFSGLVLFAVLYKNQSLLAAIFTHGLFNVIVLVAAGMNWLSLAYMLTPILLLPMAIFNLALILITLKRKKLNNRYSKLELD